MLLRDLITPEEIDETQVWARSGKKVVRKYRCSGGHRKGRIVAKMAQCFAAPDMKKRAQMKRTKEAKQFRESIATVDKIVTVGGIHGKILEVAETTILISSEGTKLRIEKSSISPNSMDQLGNQQR